MEAPIDVKQLELGHQRFYNWTIEYEFCNSFYEDWTRLKANADNTKTKVKYVNPSSSISNDFENIFNEINILYNEFHESKLRVDSILEVHTSNETAIKDIRLVADFCIDRSGQTHLNELSKEVF